MKVRCTIELDPETGSYRMLFNNVSSPGEPMDYWRIRAAIQRVLQDFEKQPLQEAQHPPT